MRQLAMFTAVLGAVSPALADEHVHPTHVAVFVGAASSSHGSGAAAGVDVERRFGAFGVALVADGARIDDANQLLVIPAVVVHPWRGLKVLAGVGWERAHGHDAVAFRAGTGYDAHVGAMSIGPSVALDRAGGVTSVVFGAAVGAGF